MDSQDWIDAGLRALDIIISWPGVVLLFALANWRRLPRTGRWFGEWFKEWMRSRDLEARGLGLRTVFVNTAAVLPEPASEAAPEPPPPPMGPGEIAARAKVFIASFQPGEHVRHLYEFVTPHGETDQVFLARIGDVGLALAAMGQRLAWGVQALSVEHDDYVKAAMRLRHDGIAVSIPPFHEDSLAYITRCSEARPIDD